MRPSLAAGQRCVVVDDDRAVGTVLTKVLANLGLQVEQTTSGMEALALITHAPETVALVVTDLRMPGMSGLDLLHVLRARAPDIVVIMCTAVSDVDLAVQCLQAGAADYLTKPFVIGEVQTRVLRALDHQELRRERQTHQERLETTVRAQADHLNTLFLTGIQSLVDALELRDAYTAGHSVRVSHHAGVMAAHLKLGPEVQRDIEIGARLHDIGKIAIADAVLQKRETLTADEYAHVMTHPAIGWRLLQPLLHDHPLALQIVRGHHERWNGSGHPDRLMGAEIPLGVRIVSVADAFDAMMSTRPYRPSLSLDEALTELRRCGGSAFEPHVVELLVALVRADGSAISLPARGMA
jgi:cyclic di-GMP phosphodiesterase